MQPHVHQPEVTSPFSIWRTAMKPVHPPRGPLPRRARVTILALAALLASSMASAFTSGSTGADGALAPASGAGTVEIQLPDSGILNYTAVNIPSGVTVKFKKNRLNTPVYLLVSGDVTVAGVLDLRGDDAKPAGTYGDGAIGDDGVPGAGGPGGFDGGRGGLADAAQTVSIIRGGSGLGPGGGKGGIEGGDGCTQGSRYYKYLGLGGAYAGRGSDGYLRYQCGGNYTSNDQAQPYGAALLQPLIGGSGGGGGRGGTTYPGSGGGGGGGAVLIAASGTITIQSTGQIDTTGGDAGGALGTGVGGGGAGGSGGAIRLIATRIQGNGALYASGGCINSSNQRRQACLDANNFGGYGGSAGRIRLEAESITFTGTNQPTYSADLPGPIFVSGVPSLRIASVAGSAVPANPSGVADVTLPANITNPVTVTFETTNVPTGNTVLLKVVPAYGEPAQALSPAIAGTTTAGTASVQVALPQGVSVLQATTTYTVVVAMGEALSRFANNERVEKVQLIATLGGESQARLITVTGKEYVVPASVLQMVGFAG